jgi:hypothetical protein
MHQRIKICVSQGCAGEDGSLLGYYAVLTAKHDISNNLSSFIFTIKYYLLTYSMEQGPS